jgi:hypothetical protein
MKRLSISGPKKLLLQLEEKLRRNFEIDLIFHDDPFCKIEAKKNHQLIVICSFTSDENIKDIMTMFEINYIMKIGQKVSNNR